MASAALTSRIELLQSQYSFRPGVLERFARFLDSAAEEDLYRMSPLRYAASHELSEHEGIDLFLRATRIGLLEFTWGVLCPACAAFLVTPAALRSLRQENCCQMCRLDFGLGDDNVEVAFNISPAVRRLRFHSPESLDLRRDLETVAFSRSRVMPALLRERVDSSFLDSATVAPGASFRFTRTLAPASHYLTAPFQHAWAFFDVSGDAPSSELHLDLFEGRIVPAQPHVRAGEVSLVVHNRTSAPIQLLLGVQAVSPQMACSVTEEFRPQLLPYLNGKRLVTNQTFRELFRAESIPSEGGLEFKSLTVLFTDLKGSTEMYERIGDFRAYGLVREHFAVLRDIIASRGGSLVKTIGDAVMASFAEPTPALEAATAMTREVRRVGREGADLQLKVGLHSGPCIAVELNERLDYFGQTVNLAARVQGVAQASEIAITEPVFSAPGAQDVIRAAALRASREQALLKGVEGEVTLYRLRS
jgi:class 3 adenylate cyclase